MSPRIPLLIFSRRFKTPQVAEFPSLRTPYLCGSALFRCPLGIYFRVAVCCSDEGVSPNMFQPETYGVALSLMIISMISWGSWANTVKLTPGWPFQLFYWDYVI